MTSYHIYTCLIPALNLVIILLGNAPDFPLACIAKEVGAEGEDLGPYADPSCQPEIFLRIQIKLVLVQMAEGKTVAHQA